MKTNKVLWCMVCILLVFSFSVDAKLVNKRTNKKATSSKVVAKKKVVKSVKSQARVSLPHVDGNKLAKAIIKKENPRYDSSAIGDKHLRHKSYGLLQIRAPYLSDVNRIAGRTKMRELWGKEMLTVLDMRDPQKAYWAFDVYLTFYGEQYTQETKKIPTVEVYARIHNGGPHGWRNPKTEQYGRSVARNVQLPT